MERSEQQVEVGQQSIDVGERSSPIIKGGELGENGLTTDRQEIENNEVKLSGSRHVSQIKY